MATRKPQPDDLVPFRVTRAGFPAWARLSPRAKVVHGIIVMQPGVTGDGWRASVQRVCDLYAEATGAGLTRPAARAVLTELEGAGFISREVSGRSTVVKVDGYQKGTHPEPRPKAAPALPAPKTPKVNGTHLRRGLAVVTAAGLTVPEHIRKQIEANHG